MAEFNIYISMLQSPIMAWLNFVKEPKRPRAESNLAKLVNAKFLENDDIKA